MEEEKKDKVTKLKLSGFLGRKWFQFRFDDVYEVVLAHMLLCKIPDIQYREPVKIHFGMDDLFAHFDPHDLSNQKVMVRERIQEMMADAINHMFGLEVLNPQSDEYDLIDYYNEKLTQGLNYLLNGDSAGLKPCLENVEIVTNEGQFNTYTIAVIPEKFVKIQSENVLNLLLINHQFYDKLKMDGGELFPAVTYQKQLDFLVKALNDRAKATGETSFDFNIKEAPFRHIVTTDESDDELLTMPSPLSLNNGQRLSLPLLLEINGIIDINSIRIVSPPNKINDIDIILSINKPAVKNRFLSGSYGLTSAQRAQMSSTELQVYEDIYNQLSYAYSFGGRKDIEDNFSLFTSWILRKMTYCLEEPSFIRDKAVDWQARSAGKKYQQMEDEFFLPFLHERLVDTFGRLVNKKPEKFGGEIDIIFGNLPVELKVNKGKSKNLIDEIVSEKYRPASQAATYAAITRLGFVVVLDLPDKGSPAITNLANCIKIISKEFDENNFNTVIVVLIFYCNLPKPSLAY